VENCLWPTLETIHAGSDQGRIHARAPPLLWRHQSKRWGFMCLARRGLQLLCRGCPSCCLRKDLPRALGTIAPMSWRLCGNWKVCVPSGTWKSARRAETNLHHCSSGETEPARSVANCCLSVKTVRDEHVNSLVRPAVQKLKSVVSVCVIQLDDRRSHLGTSEQLCMIVQSEFSEVTLAPVWYRPGFLMDVFGLEANQITGMCPALCYAKRLALLSHNVFTAISKHDGTELFCALSWKCL